MGITKSFNYCQFPMPYRTSARMAVVNEGRQPADVLFSFNAHAREVPENWGLFTPSTARRRPRPRLIIR